jgi:hypothetical protein
MAKATSTPQLPTTDRVLLAIDDGVLGALGRVVIGFATLPAMLLLLGGGASDWMLIPFLLLVLLLLRGVPAVIRKLVPFSDRVKEVWTARRRLAKLCDSYQWRKLLWIGVGLALYITAFGQLSPARIAVSSACILAGVAGTARWQVVAINDRLARSITEGVRGVG